MKSTDFLQAAIDVQVERDKQYDQPTGERSMGRTVVAFNAVTGRDLTEAEGWLLLQLLKDVRQWQNPDQYHHDSALDSVAYASLKAEALHAGRSKDGTPEVLPAEQSTATPAVCFYCNKPHDADTTCAAARLATNGVPIVLPDGSAFAVMSFPLPADHWLYAPRQYADGAVEPRDLPRPILNHDEHREAVTAAVRYAVRAATNCGAEPDFDPDALVQNAVYALCGTYC